MKRKKQSTQSVQLTFEDARKPVGRGGWRPGAGRPKGRTTVAHDERSEFSPRHPLQVTWRMVEGLPSLRRERFVSVIRSAIAESQKVLFRIIEYSVQSNHLHFICEAASKRAFASGLKGFAKRISSRLNDVLDRSGRMIDSRCHVRALRTPREVKYALRYVLLNARHHADPNARLDEYWVDPYSSGPWFDGWAQPIRANTEAALVARRESRPTAPAQTWLASIGWRQWGLLAFDETPGVHRSDRCRSASKRRQARDASSGATKNTVEIEIGENTMRQRAGDASGARTMRRAAPMKRGDQSETPEATLVGCAPRAKDRDHASAARMRASSGAVERRGEEERRESIGAPTMAPTPTGAGAQHRIHAR